MPPSVTVDSVSQLKTELSKLSLALSQPETEHTWEKIEKAVQRFTLALKGGACDYPEELVAALRENDTVKYLSNCLITERTRLSGTTLDFFGAASKLGNGFQPLLVVYFPVILRLLQRTNKLYVSRTAACISAILQNTHLPSIMPFLVEGISDKASTMRKGCADGILEAISRHPTTKLMTIDKEALSRRDGIAQIEDVIRKTAKDKEVKIREVGRQIWSIYQQEWPNRVEAFSAPLTPIMRKYLKVSAPASPSKASIARPASPTKLQRPVKTANLKASASDKPREPTQSLKTSTRTAKQPSSHLARPPSPIKQSKPAPSHNSEAPAKPKEPEIRTDEQAAVKKHERILPLSVMEDLFAPLPGFTSPRDSDPPIKPSLKPSHSSINLPSSLTPLPSPVPAPAAMAPAPLESQPECPLVQDVASLDPQATSSKLADLGNGLFAVPSSSSTELKSTYRPAATRSTSSFKPKRAPGRAMVPAPPALTTVPSIESITSMATIQPSKASSSAQIAPRPVARSVTAPTLKQSTSKSELQSSTSSRTGRQPIYKGLQSKKEGSASESTLKSSVSSSFKPRRPAVPRSASNMDDLHKSSSRRDAVAPPPPPPTPIVSSEFADQVQRPALSRSLVRSPSKMPSPTKNRTKAATKAAVPERKTASSVTRKATGSLFNRETVASKMKAQEAREKRRQREQATLAPKSVNEALPIAPVEDLPIREVKELQPVLEFDNHLFSPAGKGICPTSIALPVSPDLDLIESQPIAIQETPLVIPASIPLPLSVPEDTSVPSPYMKEEIYSPCLQVPPQTQIMVSPLQSKSVNITRSLPSPSLSITAPLKKLKLQFAASAQAFSLPLAEENKGIVSKVAHYEQISTGSPLTMVSNRLLSFKVGDSPIAASPFLQQQQTQPSSVSSSSLSSNRISPSKRIHLKGSVGRV